VSSGDKPFLTPAKIDEDDAARVLFSSQGELRIDGKGEVLPFEKRGPQRDDGAPSVLGKSLRRLLSLTKEIRSLQEDIEDGVFRSEEDSLVARDELSRLREEYGTVVENGAFQRSVQRVLNLRKDLSPLAEDDLFGGGSTPLIGSAVQQLAKVKDASTLSELSRGLERVLSGVKVGDSASSLLRHEETLSKLIQIEGGESQTPSGPSALEALFASLQETVRRLRFVEDRLEQEGYTEEQRGEFEEEKDSLVKRYREILESDDFQELTEGFQRLSAIQKSGGAEGGIAGAASFAASQSGLFGDALSKLYSGYRLNALSDIQETFQQVGALADRIGELSTDQLGSLSQHLGDALRTLRGEDSGDEESGVLRRRTSLLESRYEQHQREYASTLVDEIEDFFEITVNNSHGSYLLQIEKTVPKGSVLDVLL
jgi:hypothetical protein